MKYYVQRQLNEYGPYTLADLQRYVAQGSILLTDLTRSEGMTEWTPVSQVLGNIPIPASVQPRQVPRAPAYPRWTVYPRRRRGRGPFSLESRRCSAESTAERSPRLFTP